MRLSVLDAILSAIPIAISSMMAWYMTSFPCILSVSTRRGGRSPLPLWPLFPWPHLILLSVKQYTKQWGGSHYRLRDGPSQCRFYAFPVCRRLWQRQKSSRRGILASWAIVKIVLGANWVEHKYTDKKIPGIPTNSRDKNGLGGETWTLGLLNPIQARYQTAPHPDAAKSAYCLAQVV